VQATYKGDVEVAAEEDSLFSFLEVRVVFPAIGANRIGTDSGECVYCAAIRRFQRAALICDIFPTGKMPPPFECFRARVEGGGF